MVNRASICVAALHGFLILVPIASAQAPALTKAQAQAEAKARAEMISATFTVQPKLFDCSPKVLRAGQSLTLTLSGAHGRHLAVERQGDPAWYYLVIGAPVPGTTLFMTPDAFKKARRVVIPATVVADYRGKDARVFSKPGKYTLYTSDNLESEDPGYICEIRYAG
jgi:hypothetical protein